DNPDDAIDITITAIDDITGQKLERSNLENAWERTFFEADFEEEVIQEFGDASYDLEFLKEQPDFSEFVNKAFLELFNQLRSFIHKNTEFEHLCFLCMLIII